MPSIIAIQKPKLEKYPKRMFAGLSVQFIILSLLVVIQLMLGMLILNIRRICFTDS